MSLTERLWIYTELTIHEHLNDGGNVAKSLLLSIGKQQTHRQHLERDGEEQNTAHEHL